MTPSVVRYPDGSGRSRGRGPPVNHGRFSVLIVPGAFDPRREFPMAATAHRVGVTADLTIDVPRNDQGDLVAGARAALARVDAVDAVDDVEVTGLTPRLNDLRAEVEADLTLALERADDAREALADGFGVDVETVRVHENPPP